MWMGLNAYSKCMTFDLPKPTSNWQKVLDTSSTESNEAFKTLQPTPPVMSIKVESKSLVLMLSQEYFSFIDAN